MSIKTEDIKIIKYDTHIDHTNAVKLQEEIDKILSNYKYLILDFKDVPYISSTGIGMLIYMNKIINNIGGKMYLVNCNNEISTLLNVITNKIKVEDSINNAIEKIKSKNIEDNTEISVDEYDKPIIDDENAFEKTENTIDDLVENQYIKFDKPIVIECPECKSMVRIKQPGKYKCPDCSLVFEVEKDKTVIFN